MTNVTLIKFGLKEKVNGIMFTNYYVVELSKKNLDFCLVNSKEIKLNIHQNYNFYFLHVKFYE